MNKTFFYYLSLVTQLGFVIIASLLVGLAIGLFIDKKLNLKGIFTIIFLIFGIIGGFRSAYKMILRK